MTASSARASADPRWLRRTLLALLPPLAALILQWTFWGFIAPYVWFLFYPAVFISSRIGGLRGGLVATVASTALVLCFFVAPTYSLATHPRQLFPAGVFLVMGVIFAVFHERLRRANQQVTDALAGAQAARDEIAKLYEKTTSRSRSRSESFALA